MKKDFRKAYAPFKYQVIRYDGHKGVIVGSFKMSLTKAKEAVLKDEKKHRGYYTIYRLTGDYWY